MGLFDDALEFLCSFVLPMVVAGVVVFAGLFAVIVGVDWLDCRGFARGTGIETRWEWGCYASVDGKWVPKKYAFGDAHEVRVK